MWFERITNSLLDKRWLALFLTFLVTFFPALGTISIVFAILVTLRKGEVEGGIFTLAATLPYFTAFLSKSVGHAPPIIMWAGVGVAVLINLFAYLFAVMFRRGTSFSTLVQIAALIGVLMVSVIHLIYPDVADWWGTQLTHYYNWSKTVSNAIQDSASPNGITPLEVINITKQHATGLMVASILFFSILQLIVALWWEYAVFRNGSLKTALHNIHLSQLAGILFVVSLVLTYLGNSVILDILPIVYLLFSVAGISLLHYLWPHSTMAWLWLTIVYFVILVSIPVSLIILAVISLGDVWLDVRKQFQKG